MDTSIPRFFWDFPMQPVREARLDEVIVDDDQLRILFLWGKDCLECDVAKAQILLSPERFRWDDVRWLHDDVYQDPAMATRFGLHGVPAFMVFRGARKLGRIGQWPGSEAFLATIERIRAEVA